MSEMSVSVEVFSTKFRINIRAGKTYEALSRKLRLNYKNRIRRESGCEWVELIKESDTLVPFLLLLYCDESKLAVSRTCAVLIALLESRWLRTNSHC